ncbi:TonB-dependent receptor [Muricauda sp. SCSIO 64092]|uniref:SusC/RagA family TonB-linked outer membrane protein n=1 Tax=Allomuricauda sp. SCSIO 64092 TaxID=2908842 RepID=UPI001FF68A8F|nr:TonB-dependent receptor [Muricauda sp. SCSIO 64092]UOY04896.1 TonB-dependent receptor [Muricauda sp. SCSIO 64092]
MIRNSKINRWLYRLFIVTLLFNVSTMEAGFHGDAYTNLGTDMDLITVQQTITGTVFDTNGTPLPGANVIEKGTTNGTQTDFDGNFSLAVSSADAILVISYIGFEAKEISIQGQSSISVSLQESSSALDEVVVVGYGTQRKRDLTGAVATVKGEEFENNVINSPAQAVQGRVPGVQVSQNSGRPGAGASIRIRGLGTVNSNSPLVVIDGQLTTRGLEDINPNDIESINILKDAASASIYGSRAANGVVLVTTKRGRSGKTKVTYDTFVTADEVQDFVEQLNRDQFIAFQFDFLRNGDFLPNGITTIEEFEATQFNTANTDWQDVIFRTGLTQTHQVSVSGGSEKTNFAISAGLFDQKGLLQRSEFTRANFRLNLDHRISDTFKIGNSISLSRSHREGNENFSSFRSALFYPPTVPVFNPDGSFGFNQFPNEPPGINPLAAIEATDDDLYNNRLLGNIYVEAKILEGLTLRGSLGVDYLNRNFKSFAKVLDNGSEGQNPLADLTQNNREEKNWIFESLLTYRKTFKEKHNVELLTGYSQQGFRFDFFEAGREGFPSEEEPIRVLDAGDVASSVNNGTAGEWALQSVFGRLNYNFDNRYLLAFNYRFDGSSRFAEDERWGFFPAVSAGWNISQEEFFDVGFINNLKIRGSWGQLGNQELDNIIGLTPFATTLSLGQDYVLGVGQTPVPGAAPTALGNPNITWESTTTTNIGLDALLFDSKVSLTLDYYNRETNDMILRQPIPGSSGVVNGPVVNAGSVVNKGFEVAVQYSDELSDNFSFSIGGNISTNENEITSLATANDGQIIFGGSSNFIQREGEALNSIFGFVSDGIFQNQAEVDAAIPGHENAAPGDVRWKDVNGDGEITPDDRTILGQIQPDISYGINASINYKNIDFSVLLNGDIGRDVYRFRAAAAFRNFENTHIRWVNRWTGEGTSNRIPRAVVGDPNNNNRVSDLYVEDGDYLMIRNVQLGYSLPDNILDILGMSRLRVYVGAQNLYRFTNFTGYTPEFDGGEDIADFQTYPIPRSYVMGLNVAF